MKIQDIFFVIFILGLLYIRKPKLFFAAGLVLLFLSIPLFYFWIFFTAQRLVEYAFFLLFLGILLFFFKKK